MGAISETQKLLGRCRLFMHSSESMHELEDGSIQLALTSISELSEACKREYATESMFERIPHREKAVPFFFSGFYEALNDGISFPWTIFDRVWLEVYRTLRPNGVFILNVGTPKDAPGSMGGFLRRIFGCSTVNTLYPYLLAEHVLDVTPFILEQDFVWSKTNIGPKGKVRIFNNHEHFFLFVKDQDYKFPPNDAGFAIFSSFVAPVTQEPIEGYGLGFEPAVIKHLIETFTVQGDTVLDPMAGSGTLAAVAVQMARNAVLYEINPDLEPVIRDKIGRDLCES